jgi:hypothetical protein
LLGQLNNNNKKMKVLLFLIGSLIASTLAQQHHNNQQHQQQQQQQIDIKKQNVPILALQNNLQHDGTFNYNYESGDGSKAEQNGQLRYVGENAGEAIQGQFSYEGDDGQTYSIQYTADENGYRPVGAHLPTPPPGK